MKKNILIYIFILNCSLAFSQGGKGDYRENFTQGNLLILEQNYPLALKYFKDAYAIDSTNGNINYKMGYCYLQSAEEKNKALPYLEKAVQNVSHNYNPDDPREKGKAPEFAYYYLGTAYRLAYKFNESNTYFNKFKDIVGNHNKELTADLDKQVETNFSAIELTKDTVVVSITNLGDSINTIYPDYSPVLSADESTMIFTSRRLGSTGGDKTDGDQFMEDIYVSYKKDGVWTGAKQIGSNINTNGNEADISISADGQQLFVYRDVNGGDIYYSNLEGDTWSGLTPLNSNINTPAWETHASLSVDGNTLYFVSDRKEGSFGGRDIWKCIKLPNGQWGMPTNMGPTINTAEDEDAPFIHPDGVTLFFSSKGHKNMGGFDIFKSTKDENDKWGEAENLKSPINTPDDDIFYVQSADGKRGYFSSVRKGGYGEKDIYMLNFEKALAEPLTLLKGYITFDGSLKGLENVEIMATDMETGLVVQNVKPNLASGKYLLILNTGNEGKTYNISYEAEGYQPVNLTINIPANSSYQEIEKELLLQMVNLESKTLGTISINGTVKNFEGKAIPGTQIVIKDNTSGKLIDTYYTAGDSGTYYFILNRGQNYNLSYEAKGYLFQSENVNVPKQPEFSTVTKNIVLDKVQVGSKIVLNNIFFDSNKATLRKESELELNKLLQLMKDYPELTVEVAGHTDSKGNDAANMKLSQMRAQAVVAALIKKGIKAKFLVAKGYGETMPIAPNLLPNGKPDLKGMQLNRRVEMKIIAPK